MKVLLRLAALVLVAQSLVACGKQAAKQDQPPLNVAAQAVESQSYAGAVTLTGVVRARVQTELSFRVSGRVIERNADVGQHVGPDFVLARLDPSEQQADLQAAQAGLTGAQATMRQTAAVFERQKALLGNGFTTKAAYDQADQAQLSAAGALDAATAQLATAQDALSYTQLKSGHPGVITARNIEVGQVAQAAQPAFSFAQDGPRDVVFAVYESIFIGRPTNGDIELSLVADPEVKAIGKIHEISPTVDTKTGTVQVKVEIQPGAPNMPLGSPVTGRGQWVIPNVFVLPWTAMTEKSGKPAVWIVDPATSAVSLRPVEVELYEKEKIILRSGLMNGETVVTEGGKFLREGQIVRIQAARSE